MEHAFGGVCVNCIYSHAYGWVLLRVFQVFVVVLMVGTTTGVSGLCCCVHVMSSVR